MNLYEIKLDVPTRNEEDIRKSRELKCEDVERIVARFFNPTRNLVIPNVSWGFHGHHECDLVVVTKSDHLYEVEIKVSKADLKAEKHKRHIHQSKYMHKLFFAIPEFMLDSIELIPERAGIIVIEWIRMSYRRPDGKNSGDHFRARQYRQAKVNPLAKKITADDKFCLARLGSLRIWRLMDAISGLKKDNAYWMAIAKNENQKPEAKG